MPDTRHAQLEPVIKRRQVDFQIAIFLGIGRQFVGADIDLAPLEPLANIPDRQETGPPRREMIVLALGFTQPLPANPVARGFAVTIGAGKIEFAKLAVGERLATLD